MSFFPITDRELYLGIYHAYEMYGIWVNIDELKDTTRRIQEIRDCDTDCEFIKARDDALKEMGTLAGSQQDALKSALGKIFGSRGTAVLVNVAARRAVQHSRERKLALQQRDADRMFLDELKRLYNEDLLNNPSKLPIDPDVDAGLREDSL